MIEFLLIIIGLVIVASMAWAVEKKDKWDDLEFYDDEEL